jgi:crossover junction endodeoxyribonuclease RuvC
LQYIASGCIRTDPADSLPARLGTIFAGLRELVVRLRPDQAAVEIVFVNVNPQSTLLLGQARGAAITALVAGGIEVAEYTALQVKQAVVGNGKATRCRYSTWCASCYACPPTRAPTPPTRWPVRSRTRTAGRVSGAWRVAVCAFARAD